MAIAGLFNEVGANMQLPYKARFGGAKFGRGWDQLMYGSWTLLCSAHKLLAIYSLACEIYTNIYLRSPLRGVYAIYDRMWHPWSAHALQYIK